MKNGKTVDFPHRLFIGSSSLSQIPKGFILFGYHLRILLSFYLKKLYQDLKALFIFIKSMIQSLFTFRKIVLINACFFQLFSYGNKCKETIENLYESNRSQSQTLSNIQAPILTQDITSIKKLAEAVTKGLQFTREQKVLWGFYQNGFFSNPKDMKGKIDKVFDILEAKPDLSKPIFTEQILTFQSQIYPKPEELNQFVYQFRDSSVKRKTPLMRVEENLHFWSKILGEPASRKKSGSKEKGRLQKKLVDLLGLKLINDLKNNNTKYKETNILNLYKALKIERKKQLSQNKEVYFISQALLDLIHTAAFSKKNILDGLKDKDSFVVLNSLRQVLEYREHLALSLGFKSFMDFKDSLQLKKTDKNFYDTDKLESKIFDLERMVERQEPTHQSLKKYRVRALSLKDSPFRGCLGNDCSSNVYFETGLDPNFIYWTKTDQDFKSEGQITTVLGTAKNSKGQSVKIAFVDKIQNFSDEELIPFLFAVKKSLKEHGYILALSPAIKNPVGLSNMVGLRNYVQTQILPELKGNLFKSFKPHPNKYYFRKGFSRAYFELDVLEFDLQEKDEFTISSGERYKPYFLEDLTKELFIKSILSLRHSTKPEDIISFINNVEFLNKEQVSGFSDKEVSLMLSELLQNEDLFDFKLRKKILYALILFDLDKFIYFLKEFNQIERNMIKGELSNWSKSSDKNKQDTFKLLNIGFKLFGKDWISDLAPLFKGNNLNINQLEIFRFVISKSNLNFIKEFIKQINVNTQDNSGQTALILASIEGYKDIVKILLQKEANVNIQDHYGQTALILASIEGYKDIVKILLQKEANVNIQDHYGQTALIYASQYGHKDIVKLLIQAGADVNIQDNNSGQTALIYASQYGHKDVVKLLIQAGADVNIQNHSKTTALMFATLEGHTGIVKLLLQAGSDIHIQNYSTKTDALMLACQYGHTGIVKLLLQAGADVNIQKDRGYTSLMIAILNYKNIDIVKLLIENGADINIQNEYGHTVLRMAGSRGYTDALRLFIEKNNNAKALKHFGGQALIMASRKGYTDIVKLLLEQDIDVNVKDSIGNTALIMASRKGYTDIVKLLLEQQDIDVNVKDSIGNTALIMASQRGYEGIVRALLVKGADIQIQNDYGYTALTAAVVERHASVVKLINVFIASSVFNK